MQIDYLIVGQGLAGTVLAQHLLERQKKILVVDKVDETSSSRVAAGLFNPITGRRFVLSWNARNLFPYLHSFYKKFEEALQVKFIYPSPIFRPFSGAEEQNDWQGYSTRPGYNAFVEDIYKGPHFDGINAREGGILITGGGFVDIPLMLGKAREKWQKDNLLIDEEFDHSLLIARDCTVRYKDIEAKRIIFCRGCKEAKNEPFGWLPFRPVKGEVLHLKSPVDIDLVYNKGCFLTPALGGIHKCGSTYDWKDLTSEPTIKGRNTILSNLKALINWDVDVVGHRAGVRPATLDRKPFIGFHPEEKTFVIFNGLGTKGVSLAPYYADQFVKFLEDGTNLDIEVNIERYYSLYYNSFSQKNKR